MKEDYDKEHDILYIKLTDEEYNISVEYEDVIIDYDKDKNICGIQIFEISKKIEQTLDS